MANGVIQNSTSIAANTQVDDVLVNNILATNRQGLSVVDWGVTASATGLLITLFNGVIQLAPEFAPSLANRFPIAPDDYISRFGLREIDRVIMKVRNTTAGALTLFYTFKFRNVTAPR